MRIFLIDDFEIVGIYFSYFILEPAETFQVVLLCDGTPDIFINLRNIIETF